MRLLLDECVPGRLQREVPGHETLPVEDAEVKELKSGNPLRFTAVSFDILITVDQNLAYPQNLKLDQLALLFLAAKSNTYEALTPLISRAFRALEQMMPGEGVRVVAMREDDES